MITLLVVDIVLAIIKLAKVNDLLNIIGNGEISYIQAVKELIDLKV